MDTRTDRDRELLLPASQDSGRPFMVSIPDLLRKLCGIAWWSCQKTVFLNSSVTKKLTTLCPS